jgi:iron complex outermembrane receptor protein
MLMQHMIVRTLSTCACSASVLSATALFAQRQPADSTTRDTIARALPALQVTATAVATEARRIAQPTALLAGSELRRANSASLGETLQQIPGVRSLSMTTGIGKPVIRGLTNNRVVTLANGQRTETQQWGHDHSPNVESADAERLEVVKGPASVLYGSDALGGVVNVVRRPLPVATAAERVTRGRMATAWNSAAHSPSLTLVGEGASPVGAGSLGWRLSGTGRRALDLRTPAGIVSNTGNVTGYTEGALGWQDARADVTATGSLRDERIQVADDPITAPNYTGRQRIRTHRGTVDANVRRGGQRLQLQAGIEQNRRAEFGDERTQEVALGLLSRSASGFAHWHHTPIAGATGVVGVAAQHTRFTTFGSETLIPDNTAHSLGVYALEQRTVGDFALSAGARHDRRTLSTPGNRVLGLLPTNRAFAATTGTLGAVYRPTSPLSVAVNVARGFRAPSASDLFANGFHEGTRAFEIGRADLRVESSVNVDAALRLRTARVTGELTGYVNRIRDYIYLTPVGLPGRALDSLQIEQGNARLVGAELEATVALTRTLSLQATADVVHATNTSDDTALPFVPPPRAVLTMRWDEKAPGRHASLSSEWNARQTRTFRSDFAPKAWNVVSASAGLSRLTPRGLVHVDVSVRNLFDTRYRDFMSRYKEFADAAGRAFVLRISADL